MIYSVSPAPRTVPFGKASPSYSTLVAGNLEATGVPWAWDFSVACVCLVSTQLVAQATRVLPLPSFSAASCRLRGINKYHIRFLLGQGSWGYGKAPGKASPEARAVDAILNTPITARIWQPRLPFLPAPIFGFVLKGTSSPLLAERWSTATKTAAVRG